MKINKILIVISLLFIFYISLGAVSATDMSVKDINDDNVATVESSVVDEEINTVSEGEIHNSSEIYDEIKNSEGTYNMLTDYQIDQTWEITNGNVTIEGNNHTIYGNGKQAFYITGMYASIRNLNFVNCGASYDGGAISFWSDGSVVGCSFVGCSASDYGGAIYFDFDSNCSVNYCIFEGNNANAGKDIFGDIGEDYSFNFFGFKNDMGFPKHLIGNGKNSITPDSWIVLDVTRSGDKYVVKFVTDECNGLSQSMPDYTARLSINGVVKDITIKNNTFIDTFVEGNYLLTSLNMGNVLANVTFIPDLYINISVNNTKYGEVAIVNIELPNNANRFVRVYLDGVYYGDAGITDGKAQYNFTCLSIGEYNVTVEYDGDNIYPQFSNYTTFFVTAKGVTIILSNRTNYPVFAGENYTVTITSDGEAISGANVILELNNNGVKKNYTVKTNDEGKASLLINLGYVGGYGFNIYFNNTGYEYKVANQTINVTVDDLKFKDNYTDKTFNSTVKSGDKFTLTLVDSNDKGISGATVVLKFKKGTSGSEVEYKIKSDNNGDVKLALNLGYSGDYYIKAVYNGLESDWYTVNILRKDTILTTSYDGYFVTTTNSGDDFTVKLTSDTIPINNTLVSFKVTNKNNQSNTYKAYTNEEGYASLKLNLDYVGNYTIVVTFIGNNLYNPADDSVTSVEVKTEV